jgi:hypothetical protein
MPRPLYGQQNSNNVILYTSNAMMRNFFRSCIVRERKSHRAETGKGLPMRILPDRVRGIMLVLALLLGLAPLLLAAVTCSQCGRTIPAGRRYVQQDGRNYCSKACLELALPRCAACHKACHGGFVKDGRNYCSKACLETTFPQCAACGKRTPNGGIAQTPDGKEKFFCPACVAGPRCFCCGMPGASQSLSDGRHICPGCAASAVGDAATMQNVVEEVRQRLRDELNLGTDHALRFELVDEPTLLARSGGNIPGRELGLYRYESTIETTVRRTTRGGRVVRETVDTTNGQETYTILLLSHLSLAKLREVAAHELAHDWMQARYPSIADLQIKEGWAEYVASRINELYGQEALNQRMALNPDPDYGDGYRRIRQLADTEGKDGIYRLFDEANRAATP